MTPLPGRRWRLVAAVGAFTLCLSACTGSGRTGGTSSAHHPRPSTQHAATSGLAQQPASTRVSQSMSVLPGMPPVADPHDVYAAAGADMLSSAVRGDRPLVYVPHNGSGDGIWVIDPRTLTVIARYRHPGEWQHVVPSYDMRTLYALDDTGNHLIAFDARTGRPEPERHIIDPYNMYNTPDGKYAIVVAEARRQLLWYDPHTWQVVDTTAVPGCAGVDHGDFSADGRTAVFSCEFAGRVAVVDVASHRLLRTLDMPVRHTMMGPQDLRLAPDGNHYFVADCDAGGVWILNRTVTRVERFVATGRCAHGLYFSRDSRRLFVTNRLAGTISVLDADTGRPITTWHLPRGATPDMGNLTADGTQLWLSGRYSHAVYVLATTDGRLIKSIPVGDGPHGLCVWPQPGRYSLGHTGITR